VQPYSKKGGGEGLQITNEVRPDTCQGGTGGSQRCSSTSTEPRGLEEMGRDGWSRPSTATLPATKKLDVPLGAVWTF